MTELVERIQDLMSAPADDLDAIERTLTDGYAHALTLEAERTRIERRIVEVAHGLQRGETGEKVRELSTLAKRLDANGGDLSMLRALLDQLRRHAADVRVAQPSR
jgi:uncharacterized membrane protein YccC